MVMALTLKIKAALTDNIYYEELVAILAALTASYTGQSTLAALIATLEAQLKTARLAQVTETMNGRDTLKSAARACESYDSSDEALVSGGWDLKKPRTPSQILPAPARLKLRATAFPGVMTAIWSRVQNFRFYDYQVFVTEDHAVSPDWSTLPIGNNTVTQITSEKHPVGSLIYFWVRTRQLERPRPLERRPHRPRPLTALPISALPPRAIKKPIAHPAVRLTPGGGVLFHCPGHPAIAYTEAPHSGSFSRAHVGTALRTSAQTSPS